MAGTPVDRIRRRGRSVPCSASTVRTGLTIVLVVAVLCSAAVLGGADEAHASGTEDAFVVELEPDGNATVTLRLTFDLTDETDERAFRQAEEGLDRRSEQFRERLDRIATHTAEETGREMDVTDPRVTVETTHDVAVVEFTVDWSGLAAVDGDRLTVSEPFASGFQPDRRVVVTAPDGYDVESTTVQPDTQEGASVGWSAGTDLSGLVVVAEPTGQSVPTGLPLLIAIVVVTGTARRLAGWWRSRTTDR